MTASDPSANDAVNDGASRSSLGPAPAVVAVVVAHDPGWWFEETLDSLVAQDYPNLSVLVIDAGSARPDRLRERLSARIPWAHVRRLRTNPGFAAAANEVRSAVQGAAFYLFCHDDVRLDAGVVRLLVEEAYRSNGAIVGPKLVRWDDPARLLSVGMGADRYGQPAAYVERGDLDQSQFDTVRDVFYVPGAVTLVRADLFEAVDGFDEAITFHGEDLDLCWRAHVAGARVLVAPEARVAHLEALGVRRPLDDRRRLQQRHRLRTVRASDSALTRLRVMPFAALLAAAEILHALVIGRFKHARDVASAWWWNLRMATSTRRRRSRLEAVRRIPDRQVRAFQARRSARLSQYLRQRVAGQREAPEDSIPDEPARSAAPIVLWSLLAAFFVLGSRELLLGEVPEFGGFPSFLGAFDMFERWTTGYQTVGLGSTGPNPTGFAFLGLAGTLLFGAVGLLRTVLILGALPLGAIGMWRLTRAVPSTRARSVATVVYVAVPVALNALAIGDWGALITFAVLPWIVKQIASGAQWSPFDPQGPAGSRRPLRHRALSVGVLTAVAASIEPTVLPVVIALTLGLVLGGFLAGQVAGAGRAFAVGVGGTVAALVLLLPWSTSVVRDWTGSAARFSAGGFDLPLAEVLRFAVGPFGRGALGWAFLVTAVLPLLIARGIRLSWSIRAWTLVALGLTGVWCVGQGWGVGYLPSPATMAALAALGAALAAGLGVAAFESDLPDYHFGWRQLASLVAAAAMVLAVLPSLAAGLSGRWDMPAGDFSRNLTFLETEVVESPFRVLWLGDAATLPLSGWALDAPGIDDIGPNRELAFATSSGGYPSIAEHWPGPLSAAAPELADALQIAAQGGNTRLGAMLAPMAIRYVVVPIAPAPDPYARDRAHVPTDLLAMLDSQLDLASVTVNPGMRVYRNAAWGPQRAQLPSGVEPPAESGTPTAMVVPELAGAPAVLLTDDGVAGASGPLDGAGSVYLAARGGAGWSLRIDGVEVERRPAFGWASTFVADRAGVGELRFATPVTHSLALVGQVLMWVIVIVWLLRVRVREDERIRLSDDAPDGRVRSARSDRGRSGRGRSGRGRTGRRADPFAGEDWT